MDLLLYLVKKHEVDITQVPISRIAGEFVAYLDVLEDLAIDQVGDVASSSRACSSRSRPGRSCRRRGAARGDRRSRPRRPRARLLEYKQYRDAAVMLEDRARQWELRFPRLATDEPRASRPQRWK